MLLSPKAWLPVKVPAQTRMAKAVAGSARDGFDFPRVVDCVLLGEVRYEA